MEFKEVSQSSISKTLKLYFENLSNSNIYVIVVGANNGQLKDFLSDYLMRENVNGILLEPIKYLFDELCNKFSGTRRFVFENSAIYRSTCKKNMFRVIKSEEFPAWTNGLASFNKKSVVAHSTEIQGLEKKVKKELVNCITFSSLLKKYDVKAINILQIDTEGFDYEIIKLIDFNVIRPDIIIFEYLHLSFYDYFAAIHLLQRNNYNVNRNRESMDLFAIDNEIL